MCNKNSGIDNSHSSPTKEVKYHYPDEMAVITQELPSMIYKSGLHCVIGTGGLVGIDLYFSSLMNFSSVALAQLACTSLHF